METIKSYSQVKKVYSVNIVYFDLGQGDDYVYHGTTAFIGIHSKHEMELSEKQKALFKRTSVADLYITSTKNLLDFVFYNLYYVK